MEAHLGRPPFEEPSITKAVINFLFVKYGKSGDLELQCMFEASKLFLCCLNMWKFETPACFSKRAAATAAAMSVTLNNHHHNNNLDESHETTSAQLEQKLIALYKLNYTRWMCYNYVPSFCDSLEKYETIMIFGVSFLRLVFALVKQEIETRFVFEKEKIPAEKRALFSMYLPRFDEHKYILRFEIFRKNEFFISGL